MQMGIAAACGFVAALILSRGWISSAVIGFLAAAPFAVFSVYMYTGGVEGAGFDASQLPEGSGSMMTVITMFVIMFGVFGIVGGLVSAGIKRIFGRSQ